MDSDPCSDMYIGCVIPGRTLASLSLFPHLWKVDNNIYIIGVLGWLEVTYKMC